jgi:WhiB family redox-sensing transcriptional regulator
MEWVHRAKCKDEDPELFFPVGTTGPAAAQIDDAKAICMQCAVRLECLDWALATGQDAGVWGGMSEEERRALRRARRREAAAERPVAVVG